MNRFAPAAWCIAACALLAPSSSFACSVLTASRSSPAAHLREARLLIDNAAAIVDGEVVRPFDDSAPALVRISRVLRGPAQEFIQVGERNSCDTRLTRVGTRLRLILVGGPDVYYLPVDYSNALYEDRVLGSDRRRDWPYRSGAD